jgi:hypothetical protein
MGWATFHLRGLKREQIESTAATARNASLEALADNAIENEYFRLTFDLNSGAITSLRDKGQDWETLRGPGNVIAMQPDKGDLWELHHGLDGASHVAMKNRQAVPVAESETMLSSGFSREPGTIRRGSVLSEFKVKHPLGSADFETRVRLYRRLKRIDIQTALVTRHSFRLPGSEVRDETCRKFLSGRSNARKVSSSRRNIGQIIAMPPMAWLCSTAGCRAT